MYGVCSVVFESRALLTPLRLCFVCYKWTVTHFPLFSLAQWETCFSQILLVSRPLLTLCKVRKVVANVIADVLGVC